MSKPKFNSALTTVLPNGRNALSTTTGSQGIATRMAENLLGLVRNHEPALISQRRYRLGDYEFREADHAQIQRWARMLGMEAEEVLDVLASSKRMKKDKVQAELQIEDGAIISLVWDFERLPLNDWAWGQGLQIVRLDILNATSGILPPLPACLRVLECSDNHLTKLDLTSAKDLQTLDCGRNKLTELNLSSVPRLQSLYCASNQLTELNLSHVPGLQKLQCRHNELAELNLSPVPGIQELYCDNNQLTELNLSHVTGLQSLYCGSNSLTELDLTSVIGLQELICFDNLITRLDLGPVPDLRILACDSDAIHEFKFGLGSLQPLGVNCSCWDEVDLTSVPHFGNWITDVNTLIAFDLTALPRLQNLKCQANELSTLDLTRLLRFEEFMCQSMVRSSHARSVLRTRIENSRT